MRTKKILINISDTGGSQVHVGTSSVHITYFRQKRYICTQWSCVICPGRWFYQV